MKLYYAKHVTTQYLHMHRGSPDTHAHTKTFLKADFTLSHELKWALNADFQNCGGLQNIQVVGLHII